MILMQLFFFIQDLDKIFYIISKIKKNCDIKVLQEKKECQRLIEVLPKLTNELKTLKGEWENFKSSTELNIKDYSGYKLQQLSTYIKTN